VNVRTNVNASATELCELFDGVDLRTCKVLNRHTWQSGYLNSPIVAIIDVWSVSVNIAQKAKKVRQ